MKGWIAGFASVLLVSLAQLLLRAAMKDFPPLDALLALPISHHASPLLLLGAGLLAYALSMLCWMFALSQLALNRLYPMLSLSYVLVWLAAILLPGLGEAFSWHSFAGVVLILFGLLCVVR